MVSNLMLITIGSTILRASLHNNTSVTALKELLEKNPLTIKMDDYANMEKVGEIGTTLPRNDIRMNTVPGDIILYLGTRLVIYYSTNTYSLTPIGKIEGVTQAQLKEILGTGSVTVTFSLDNKDIQPPSEDETKTNNDDLTSSSDQEESSASLDKPPNDDDKKGSKTALIAGTVSAAAVVVIVVIVATITCYVKKVGCFKNSNGHSTSEAN